MSIRDATERLVRTAKALGDSTRLELLRRIAAAGEIRCSDLVALFPVAQATVSHHLKILAASGLVSVRREGQSGWYSLRPGAVALHVGLLTRTLSPQPQRKRSTRT